MSGEEKAQADARSSVEGRSRHLADPLREIDLADAARALREDGTWQREAMTNGSARTRIFSAIQPTGALTLGNYLGAVKGWVELQRTSKHDVLFCVADYHALTVRREPAELRANTLELVLDLMGCGIDPSRSVFFLQSQVPEHTELAWILSSIASCGELTRMTQFKEKGSRHDLVSLGLFAYPVLMAADILLYKASRVPVGEDQLQHLELAREIARRFNQRFGPTFPEPEPILTPTKKLLSLADPRQKMSKSLGPKHYLAVFEDEASIRAKIRAAVTDAGGAPGEASPGVRNLFHILAETAPAAELRRLERAREEGSLRYAELKEAVTTHLLAAVAPLRQRRASLDESFALAALVDGAARAGAIARATLADVRDRVGILDPRSR